MIKQETKTSGQRVPRATYRLQFHRGFTLREAEALIPYLRDLGVSHVYSSPLLKARQGSTHGYDVCDCSQLNPEIGTGAELESFVAALHAQGMGLVLDIVPNHLAADPENPWWWDVLKHGRASRYADHFDVDWNALNPQPLRAAAPANANLSERGCVRSTSRSMSEGRETSGETTPSDSSGALRLVCATAALRRQRTGSLDTQSWGKILLPVLGDDLDRVLERGELKVARENSEVKVRYYDHRFPACPESFVVPHKTVEQAVASFNASREAMAAFLDRQHYQLAFWKHGDARVNYRRFFNVSTLAGVRVEDPRVFADTHVRIIEWHQRGWLDGLRIDHPDGLRDPKQYLDRLQQAAPGTWTVVEKILEPGEVLPADWPVAGTTGYDFLNRVAGVFVDPSGERPLTDFYAEFTGEPTDYAALVRRKKRQALLNLLAAEAGRLTRLLQRIAARGGHAPAGSELRETLIEVIACFPVYRTYEQPLEQKISPADIACVREALAAGRCEKSSPAPSAFDLIEQVFLQPGAGTPPRNDDEIEFIARFQQLTGPAMAKGVEDTTFYCFNRFTALNEVGGDPGHFGLSVAQFHQSCAEAREHWPDSMLATSTHDTKRSEDVRARLALLSEIPGEWITAVRSWSARNERHRRNGLPDCNAEYLFYQTLVGAWPLSADRALACMEKASREAKQHTSWNEPNAAYDAALKHFVTAALNDSEFKASVARFVAPLIMPGRLNSLSQTLLKLTSPGVPDIYQGTELWDLSLVDPDNRRPVDFDARGRAMHSLSRKLTHGPTPAIARELLDDGEDGRLKLFVIREALNFRRKNPELFQLGDYIPLRVSGDRADHVCAFSRSLKYSAIEKSHSERLETVAADVRRRIPEASPESASLGRRLQSCGSEAQRVIVIVPRLVRSLTHSADWPLGEAAWGNARLQMPRDQAEAYRNRFTGETLSLTVNGPDAGLALAQVFADFPLALLEPVR